MKVYIVTMSDQNGSEHVVEVFSDEKKSIEYFNTLCDMYPIKDGWEGSWTPRELDVEALCLTDFTPHLDKINDPEWVSRWNTYVPNEDE